VLISSIRADYGCFARVPGAPSRGGKRGVRAGRLRSACTSLSPARSRAKLETGSAHAKARIKKRKEFGGGCLNPIGQAAAGVDEAVLAYASGWCRAFSTVPTKMPNNTAHVTPSKTYGRGTGGVGRPAPNMMGRAGSEILAQQERQPNRHIWPDR
jgi:hypothetical protein